MMNTWRKALGIGGIFALLATANAGCAVSFEPEEAIDEAVEELTASGLPSQDNDTDGDDDAPSGDGTTDTPVEIVPDPLPWKELVPTPDLDFGVRQGPDPLPWTPGQPSTSGAPTSGTKKDW
jgi:hypothetical protein